MKQEAMIANMTYDRSYDQSKYIWYVSICNHVWSWSRLRPDQKDLPKELIFKYFLKQEVNINRSVLQSIFNQSWNLWLCCCCCCCIL